MDSQTAAATGALPGMEDLVPAAPRRRARSPATVRARRWLETAHEAATPLDCRCCNEQRVAHVVAAFERCDGRDLMVLRRIAAQARAGAIDQGGEEAIARSTFRLLVEHGAAEDLDDVFDLLLGADPCTSTYAAVTQGLGDALGDVVVPRLLSILEDTTDLDVRRNVLDALALRTDRMPGVLRALVDSLDDDAEFAAGALAEYGDPAALPALRAALGRTAVPSAPALRAGQDVLELAVAIESLGGTLDRVERNLLQAVRRLRRRNLFAPLDRPISRPALAPPRTGPNAPCPCGSGGKFKKCCG